MTDAERAQDPLSKVLRTSCMNSVDLVEFFVGSLGVPLESLIDGLRVDADFLRNTANWIDNYDTYKLYHNCHRAMANFSHRDWHRVGQAVHTNNAAGYFRILLKLLSTDMAYRRIPAFIAHTSKVSEYQVIAAMRGHIVLRYAIPDRRVALGYTIGSECWYHLGILSALPRLQSDAASFAATSQEICSMPVGHILENCYDKHPPDYSYTSEGIEVLGTLLGRWIRLRAIGGKAHTYASDYDFASRQEANAILIVRDLDVHGTHAFAPGEIYDAPHCIFDIRYENQPLVRRLAGAFSLRSRYYEEQLRRTEELFLDLHKLRYEERRLEQTLRRMTGGPIMLPSKAPAAGLDGWVELTPREREIADCVALGMTNDDIARELFISRETVKRHLSNIFMKTGVKNRVQLVRKLSAHRTL
jgi:DNA-binding CsgD family transcriptional regulator